MRHDFPPLEVRPWTTHAAATIVTPDDTVVTGVRVVAEAEDPRMARLFAAAPDLLDALGELLNALPSATTHPAIKKARAAIARASGAQP